jgi:single-strand DNA-binding protein
MMPALNRVQLIGRLGKNPESRKVKNGSTVATFSLAVSSRWKKDGVAQESTEWVNIEAWGRTAEICDQYLRKGSLVYLEGPLKTERYEDKSGAAKYFTKVVATQLQMLDRRPSEEPAGAVEEEQAEYAV